MEAQHNNIRLQRLLLGAAVLLCCPAIAMLFTEEVNWRAGDFMVAAILLVLMVGGIEWSVRRINHRILRTVFIALAIGAVALIWIELAVGILASPWAGN